MIVFVIGERISNPNLTNEEVAQWWDRWMKNPAGSIRIHQDLGRGMIKERLLGLTSIKPGRIRVVNLLPPTNKPGTWDSWLAEYCTVHLLSWLAKGEHDWERIIMLGKRVSCELTDRPRCDFGHAYDLCGIPALCFPLPEGGSQYLDEADYKEKARMWARKFLKGI